MVVKCISYIYDVRKIETKVLIRKRAISLPKQSKHSQKQIVEILGVSQN